MVADVRDRNLPDFSLVIPDLNDDGHDTGVAYADGFQNGASDAERRILQQVQLEFPMADENGSPINFYSRGGRVVALERYPLDKAQMQGPVRNVAQAASSADAIFIPDGADAVPTLVQALTANGIDTKRVQLLGTGLWEDAQIFSSPLLDGAWYAGPDSTGFRNFSARYRSRYGRDPVRTASLAYDAVALVAALVKTQGKQRFSDEVLTNSSGFTGIDGLFRFRPDGTNQRGLAVLRVSPTGGQVISPPPKGFGGSAT